MDFQKTALLIIDMQKDVLRELVKTGINVVPEIQKALAMARSKRMPIIHLVTAHRKSGIDVDVFRSEHFKKKPFLVEGTDGAKIIDELTPLPTEHTVNKKRFSGFFQSDLLMVLMRLKVNALVICGVQTPNCIRATVTDGLAYDYDVTLLEDAITAGTQEVHQANLFDMRNMGAHIKTVDSIF